MNDKLPEHYKVVAIGGGHGLGQLLKSLSYLNENLTAIVTTTDNGGSSGDIRNLSPSIAWGDIRNCLSALSKSNSTEAQLFSYRFTGDKGLGGHTVGNILLHQIAQTTTPLKAIETLKHQLGVSANIFPMLEAENDLVAYYSNGEKLIGELEIDSKLTLPVKMFLSNKAIAIPKVIQAINQADLIIFAPGSFLTSILPCLLVDDYSKAIADSSAKLVLIDNITPEQGPAGLLTTQQKLKYLESYIDHREIDILVEHASSLRVTTNQIQHPMTYGKTGLHSPAALCHALANIHLHDATDTMTAF